MTLIGISGKKNHGKDAVYQHIKSLCEPMLKVQRIGFADALKEEVALACGVSLEFVEKNKTTFRTMLQWWGTEFRRNLYDDNYWIEQVMRKIHKSQADIVVIADVRFLNEANALRNVDAILVRVIRSFQEKDKDNHPSEVELDGYEFDRVILNTGTLEDLRQNTKRFLTSIQGI